MKNQEHHLIGMRLGTCVLKQLVGSGGMGMVYLAEQTRPVRDVAVKVLRSGLELQSIQNQEFIARFRREANVIARLDHINIMPMYEYGEQDGYAYLVMPYLAGGSLRDLLLQRGCFSPQEALRYIEQAAAALQYAHEHKIVHRDIKPGNMLFHADGRLVLVDFGIAHIIHDEHEPVELTLTSSEHFLGSVEYMAPEMVKGRPVDHRTDIYELGIVLFQMLAGRVPFQGTAPLMIAVQHLEEPPPHLPQLNPAISPAIDAVVHKAIAKKPDERYQSAREFMQALREAVLIADSAPWTQLSSSRLSAPWPSGPINAAYNDGSLAPPVRAGHVTPRFAAAEVPVSEMSTHMSSADSEMPSVAPHLTQGQALVSNPGIQPKKRSSWIAVMLTLCLIIVLLIGGFLVFGSQMLNALGVQGIQGHAATPTAVVARTATVATTSTATETPAQQAGAVVQDYYTDIDQADYHAAYQLWGTNYQQNNPYTQFAQGFASTQYDALNIGTITQLTDGTYYVDVAIAAKQKDGTTNYFTGSYTVGQEHGSLKLLTAEILVAPTPTPIG